MGMLLLAVAGLGLPTALILSDEMDNSGNVREYLDKNGDGVSDIVDGPTESMLGFSRLDSVFMVVGYGMYLVFQLGTHGEEFDDLIVVEEEEMEEEYEMENGDFRERRVSTSNTTSSRRNKFCSRLFGLAIDDEEGHDNSIEMYERIAPNEIELMQHPDRNGNTATTNIDTLYNESNIERVNVDDTTVHSSNVSRKRIPQNRMDTLESQSVSIPSPQDAPMNGEKKNRLWTLSSKSHCSDGSVEEEGVVMMPVSEVCEEIEEGMCSPPCIFFSQEALLHYSTMMTPFLIFYNVTPNPKHQKQT